MTVDSPFRIFFSDLSVRFIPPSAAQLPDELSCLLCEDAGPADAEYELRLLQKPLTPQGQPFHCFRSTEIYHTEEGWLRIYPLKRSEDGCQVACLLRPNGKNILYYPEAMWAYYASPLHCAHLMGIEALLLRRNAFLLHSSVVELDGKAVLFCGPSGSGKSTQADLWKQHLGADILNGDRCVVMGKEDGFYGGGSPLAGHSRIYRPEQAPIAGIFLVNQSADNRVTRLGASAFSALFSQTLINSWDTDFMAQITTLFQQLLLQVPIYRLDCRPDAEAVSTAYHTLF